MVESPLTLCQLLQDVFLIISSSGIQRQCLPSGVHTQYLQHRILRLGCSCGSVRYSALSSLRAFY